MSSKTKFSLRTYLIFKFTLMAMTITAAIFIYYYAVERYSIIDMDKEYLYYEDREKLLNWEEVDEAAFREYGLTIHIVDKQLQIIKSVGLHAGEKSSYTMNELIETCSTDRWERYVMYTNTTDNTGSEIIIIWIQDMPPAKMVTLRNKLNLMIALLIAGVIIIIITFVYIYYRDISGTLVSEFLYIQERITKIPHQYETIDTSQFRLYEAEDLAQSYNDTIHEMTEIKTENTEILKTSNQLITDLSHDIKSPLTSLSGYIKLIREETDSEGSPEKYITYIENSINDLNNIVTMLFEQIELRRTQITLNKTPNDINNLLREVCAYYYPSFTSRGFSMDVGIEEKAAVLEIDRVNIKRVFNNILDNFLRHNPRPTAVAVRSRTSGNLLIIEFMNNGEEIPDEIKPEIFNPYFRRNKENPEQGSGLGLHIAKSIIEKHGGSISLTSADSYSTVFKLSLIYS